MFVRIQVENCFLYIFTHLSLGALLERGKLISSKKENIKKNLLEMFI